MLQAFDEASFAHLTMTWRTEIHLCPKGPEALRMEQEPHILQNPTDLLSLKCLSHTPVYYMCIPQFPSICKSSIQYGITEIPPSCPFLH